VTGTRDRKMGPQPDLYALGWKAGLETARRSLMKHRDDPEAALREIQHLLIQAHRPVKGRR